MAVGAAFLPLVAQAAPEFYGRLDVSTSYMDQTAGNNNEWSVDSTKNWVGIKGDAALYNDNLKLIYQFERGINLTDNNQVEDDGGDTVSTSFTARNSYLGIASDNWGKVFLGTYDGVVKKAEGKVDQFNNTLADMESYISGQNRYANTINYQSANYSGLSFSVQSIQGEGRDDASGDTLPYDEQNDLADGYGVGISFTQDTFWANLAYEKGAAVGENPTTLITGDIGIETLRATAGMNIGNIEFAALYQQNSDDLAGSDTLNDMLVSGAFAVSDRLKLKAQYGMHEITSKRDQNVITLGADYELGKNVTSYALIQNNKSDAVAPGGDDIEFNAVAVGLAYKF